VKGILNKLTPEKFERLLAQLLEVVTTADILEHTITLVFENAVAQPTFCAMYADLCLNLSKELPSFPPAGVAAAAAAAGLWTVLVVSRSRMLRELTSACDVWHLLAAAAAEQQQQHQQQYEAEGQDSNARRYQTTELCVCVCHVTCQMLTADCVVLWLG
jgi:hypothetical protein